MGIIPKLNVGSLSRNGSYWHSCPVIDVDSKLVVGSKACLSGLSGTYLSAHCCCHSWYPCHFIWVKYNGLCWSGWFYCLMARLWPHPILKVVVVVHAFWLPLRANWDLFACPLLLLIFMVPIATCPGKIWWMLCLGTLWPQIRCCCDKKDGLFQSALLAPCCRTCCCWLLIIKVDFLCPIALLCFWCCWTCIVSFFVWLMVLTSWDLTCSCAL